MSAYADTQCDSKVISSDRSNYWRYYGLHRDPFMPIVEDNNFFLPTRWEEHFDLLQYLCESTNVLLSVVGSKGSGKTTFMRQFIAQASENAKVCRLVGSTVLTAAQLSATLIKDFSLTKPITETTEETWEALCQNMQTGLKPFLLVIDDAHRLPTETLQAILTLTKLQSEHQMRLHTLLIGEVQLVNMLNSLKENDTERELTHTITLEPLSLQTTEAFIKHRLAAAGLPGGMPLRVNDLARIYKLSEGVPGRINAVARQVLIDVMQQRQIYSFGQFIRTRRTQLLGTIVLFGFLLALAFLLTRGNGDPVLQLYKLIISEKTALHGVKSTTAAPATQAITKVETPIVTPAQTAAMQLQPTTPVITSARAQIAPTAQVATSRPVANATLTTSTPTNSLKATALTPTLVSNVTPTAELNIQPTNQPGTPDKWYATGMVEFKSTPGTQYNSTIASPVAAVPTKRVEPTPLAQTPINNVAAPQAKPMLAVASTAKLAPAGITRESQTAQPAVQTMLTQASATQPIAKMPTVMAPSPAKAQLIATAPLLNNPKNYTLQLIGVSSEAAANQFINKYQLNDQAYFYQSHLHGKNWFVVIYGDFTSHQAAEEALSKLPSAVKDLRPWSRTLKSVSESINHNNIGQITKPVTTSPSNKIVTTAQGQGLSAKEIQDRTITITSTK